MRTLSLIGCTVVALVICSAAQLRCEFKDLQFPNGFTLGVEGISDRGEAVGDYFPPNGPGVLGFYFFDGKFVSISHPHSTGTIATGVSDRGVIVGYFEDGVTVRGFRYENGKFMTVNFPHSASTQVLGINEIGQMVGGYTDDQDSQFGFLFRAGSFFKIEFPGSSGTTAYGISRDGTIVGTYSDSSGASHGFKFSGGHYEAINFPGAVETVVVGISSRNWIVGDYDNGTVHGFVLIDGDFHTEDDPKAGLSTVVFGANVRDQIAGSYVTNSGKEAGFLATCALTGQE
jgi:probable HAF family extracellular repeat protein